MIVNLNDTSVKELVNIETKNIVDYPFSLIVWNDDINTFDWIIDSLVEVCQHSTEQAEQCALIIHFQGKYAVKNGDYDSLKVMCNAIVERGINATIEEIANK